MSDIQRLNTADPDFWPRLEALTAWEGVADDAVTATVREILAEVRQQGDAALLDYTRRFDHRDLAGAAELEISAARRQQALDSLPAAQRAALINAAARNPVLAQTWRNVNARLQALRFRSNFDEAKWKRAVKEHERMVELLAARDAAGLRALLIAHLMHKRDAVLELMKKGQLGAQGKAQA